MEVHAHTHTARKKWTHYFWEFLMLFLAVFCGFLAEYKLEHMIEKQREKDYISLLIEDLQTDTTILHTEIPKLKQTVKGLDTLVAQTYAYIESKSDTRLLYYTYHHYCRNLNIPVLAKRAINQLKNSGNTRLIKNKEAAKIVMETEVMFDRYEEYTTFYKERQSDPAEFGMKIFDFAEYQKANTNSTGDNNLGEEGFRKLDYQPILNGNDPAILKEFAARVGYYRNSLNTHIIYLEGIIPQIEQAVKSLKKNYHY
jgi:hypothetical protein